LNWRNYRFQFINGQQQSWGNVCVLKTITVGNYISVQGIFEKALSDGRIEVRVGSRIYTGSPVSKAA
jgi:hypothetical protein